MPDGGRLSWNSVAAPDFGSSIQAYKAFSDMMSQAAQSGQDVVKGIQTAQGTNADRALQLNLMKYTNPEDLQAAEANGSALNGVNTNHLTPDQLAAVPGRVTTLLSQQTTGLNNDSQRITNALDAIKKPIEGTDATNSVAARPFQFDLHKIAMDPQYAKDPVAGQAAVTKYLGDNPNASKALSLLPDGAQYQNFQDIQNLVRNSLTNQGSAIGNTDAGLGVQDKQYNLAAEAVAGKIRALGGGIRDWSTIIDNPKMLADAGLDGLPQNVLERARRILVGPEGQTMTSAFVAGDGQQGSSGGGGGTPSGGGAGYNAVYGNGQYGTPGVDPTSMTVGQVLNFGDSTLRPNTKAKGVGVLNGQAVGTSAMGAYQIEGSTLARIAPKVLGANWQNTAFTPQVQDKLGQAIYDEAPTGTDLHNIWTSLPVGTIKGQGTAASWNGIQPKIVSGESGMAPMLRNNLSEGAQTTALTTNLNQNSVDLRGRAATALANLQNSTDSADEIAHSVTTKGGTLEGNNAGDVREAIQAIIKRTGGRATPAQAEWMLEQTRTSDRGWLKQGLHSFAHSVGLTNDNLTSNVDDEQLGNYINMVKNPTQLAAEAARSQVSHNASQMVAGSQQALSDARQEYMRQYSNAYVAGRPFNEKMVRMMLERTYGLRAGSLSVGSEVAGSGNPPSSGNDTPTTTNSIPAPAPRTHINASMVKASAPAGPVNSNQPDHTGRQFGPLKIFVPENQFNNQNDLNNYVQQKSDQVRRIYAPAEQMSMKAQGILRMGGAVGNAQRAAFQSQYKMTPEQALQVAGQRMNQAKAMLRSYQ